MFVFYVPFVVYICLLTAGRCEQLRDVAHVTPLDGAIEATAGNTERMVCETGYQFADGSDYIDVTCTVDSLTWNTNLIECNGKRLNGLQLCALCCHLHL